MNNINKISLFSIVTILGFALWRNYGVKAKGSVILDANNNTNEQKELLNNIKGITPKEGDEVKTSFGYYKLSNGNWIKTDEIWDK